jgi:hypothetical protein
MRFSRILLIVAAALPLGACFVTAEDFERHDDGVCRDMGLKRGTLAYAQCRQNVFEPAANGSAYRHAESDVEPARALITPEVADVGFAPGRCTDWQRSAGCLRALPGGAGSLKITYQPPHPARRHRVLV